jgi:hypothetical protein
MQFESWDDAVKRAKVKRDTEDAPEDPVTLVPDQSNVDGRNRWFGLGLAMVGLGLAAAGAVAYRSSNRTAEAPPSVASIDAATKLAARPTAPPFTFLDIDGDMAKDVLTIRLREKVPREVLAGYCREIHARKAGKAGRTVVFVYLPQVDAYGGRPPFGSPWALVEFDPGRKDPGHWKVEIMGLTIEEEADLLKAPVQPGVKVVGRWVEDSMMKWLQTIYERGGVLYLECQTGPVPGETEELIEFRHPEGVAFRPKAPSLSGLHYVINSAGDLESRRDRGRDGVGRRVN